MNRKGDINFQTVLIILAAATLLGSIVIFAEPTIKIATNFLDQFGFDFAAEDAITETIDEERIDADTPPLKIDAVDDDLYVLEIDDELLPEETFISMGAISYDDNSGLTKIEKGASGEGWILKGFATKEDEQALYVEYQTKMLSITELQEKQILLEGKELTTIFDSPYTRGSLTLEGLFGDDILHTESQNDFQWFIDKNGDEKYQVGESITSKDLAIKIIAALAPKTRAQFVHDGKVYIKKQAYGQGWNLEFDEPEIYAYYQSHGVGSIFSVPSDFVLISNKPLAEILTSPYIRGSITVNGKTYIHTPSEHNLEWFADDGDGNYEEGEEIETEKLSQLILASKWEEATG
ncbi:MAG: hypothetical protein AABX82_02855 [Nanoarchaeota archaeon]